MRLRRVSFSVKRANEYTEWRPVSEWNEWFGYARFGIFSVDWEWERRRRPTTCSNLTKPVDSTSK